MYVKNANSIKRPIIAVCDNTKNNLVKNGYYPVSKSKDGWVYIYNSDIKSLLSKFEGGGG